jgi:hypothetical protein
MHEANHNELIQLFRLAERLQLERDPGWRARLGRVRRSCARPHIISSLLRMAQRAERELERRPLFLPLPPTATDFERIRPNDVTFADVVETPGLRCGLSFAAPQQIVTIGTTGAGKTTHARALIKATHDWNLRAPDQAVQLIILDRKGGDFADIPAMLGAANCANFCPDHGAKWGLQRPEGVPVRKWINQVARVFTARSGLKMAEITFANVLEFAFQSLNPPGRPGPELWPSLSLLLELLEACPETTFSYKGDYARSLKTRLSGLVRAAGPALECFSGLDLFQHVLRAGKSCVLSMANMRPAWYRQFVTDLLVSQLLLGAVERRERTDRVRVLLIIEEADADVSQEAEQAYEDGLMPITEVFKTGREFGIGAYLSLSRPQSASQLISGNATTHFAFKVLDANATTRVRDTLMLGPDAGRLPATLRTGECLVRTFDWPHVFLAKVDHMPPCREAHVSYDEHPYQQALNLNELPELRRDLQARSRKRNARKTKAPQPKQQPAKKSKLSLSAGKLLDLAKLHPWWPVVRLLAKHDVHIGPATLMKVRHELRKQGLADTQDARIGQRNYTLILPKDAAYERAKQKPPKLHGVGGIEHRHYAHWVRMVGDQRGYESHCEWIVPQTNHAADVAWRTPEGWEVFEIVEEEHRNLPSHIVSSLAPPSEVLRLTIVSKQKKLSQQHAERLSCREELDPYRDRIRYAQVIDFMKELWP